MSLPAVRRAWRRFQLWLGAPFGFRDWVMFPEARNRRRSTGPSSAAEAECTPIEPENVETVIESIFDPASGVGWRRLVTLGPALLPVIKRLLSDPRTAAVVWKRQPHCMDEQSPMQRVCALMRHSFDDESVEKLVALYPAHDAIRRPYVISAIALSGSDVAASMVATELDTGDAHTVGFALGGIRACGEAQRLSERCRREWTPIVERLVSTHEYAARTLLDMDRERARFVLTSESVLNAQTKTLRHVLSALTRASIDVSLKQVSKLLAELDAEYAAHVGDTSPNGKRARYLAESALSAALAAMAEGDDARTALERFRVHVSGRVRAAAEARLSALEGLPDPGKRARDIVQQRVWSSVPRSVQAFYAADTLVMDLMDGGILSYLTHGNADHWRDALRFFEEAGDARSADAFRNLMTLCGPDGPPIDARLRQRWLADDLDRLERSFETAQRLRPFSDWDDVAAALVLYARKHRDDFRA